MQPSVCRRFCLVCKAMLTPQGHPSYQQMYNKRGICSVWALLDFCLLSKSVLTEVLTLQTQVFIKIDMIQVLSNKRILGENSVHSWTFCIFCSFFFLITFIYFILKSGEKGTHARACVCVKVGFKVCPLGLCGWLQVSVGRD